MASESEWDNPSGNLTDYEGTVIDAKFEVSGRGNLQCCLTMATDNPDLPEWTERYNCGQDWKSMDGGETAEGGRKFTANTQYGEFILSVKNALAEPNDTPDQLNNRIEELLGDSPRVASVWIGCRFYMEEKDKSFTNRETNEKVPFFKNFPAKFLGKDEELKGEGPVNHPSSQPSPSSQPTNGNGSNSNPLAVLPESVQSSLKGFAPVLSHSDWCDKVLIAANDAGLLPGSVEYDTLISAVADESGLYTTLRG